MLSHTILANRTFRPLARSARCAKPTPLRPVSLRPSHTLPTELGENTHIIAAYRATNLTSLHRFSRFVKCAAQAPIRSYHVSSALEKKSTSAIRRERAEAMQKPPAPPKSGVIFEVNSRTFFMVITGVAIFQALFFLGAAEFYWQYDVSLVDGMNAGASFLSRLVWPTFFAAIGSFLPITRHFFGSRYIQKLELMPNQSVNIYTYDFFVRPRIYANVPVESFRPQGYNDKGDYHKVKLRGYKWFFIMDKKGEISDPAAFSDIVRGKRPDARL